MKVIKVEKNDGVWIDLQNPVNVMTRSGPKECRRVFLNGVRDVYELVFSDGSSWKFTGNHRLMSDNNEWVEVNNIEPGFVFDNLLTLKSKKHSGVEFVMDMEVPDVHHYILENGVSSHNSSFILGQVSQGIEPLNSNYFVKNLAKLKATYKNPYLKKVLKDKEMDTDDIWESILIHGGSVQHLDFLDQNEKDVFKTFGEISQKEIVIQASSRQKYIDQSQSLNLMIPPDASAKEVSQLLIFGWENKVKTFYYQRSSNPSQKLMRSILTCSSCEA